MPESPDERGPINRDSQDHFQVYGIWLVINIVLAVVGFFLLVEFLS